MRPKYSSCAQKITTDIPGKKGGYWHNHSIYCRPFKSPRFLNRCFGEKFSRRIFEILTSFKLLLNRRKTVAYVTSGTLIGISFAVLQTILFWNRKPHVLLDCIWYQSSNSINNIIFSLAIKIASPSVKYYIVWASHEIIDYPYAFKVNSKKFYYVHFWHTLTDYKFDIKDAGYVFAGGNWDRDFGIVIKAAKKMPTTPFIIGTTRPNQLDRYLIPNNVTVIGYTPEGFRQAIAECRIMVVPMVEGVLHSGGQQTVLNALYMGKPTIAVGKKWATDLINDGTNGYIVDYKDSEHLAIIIEKLWNDSNHRQKISINAEKEGRCWPPERALDLVYRLTFG